MDILFDAFATRAATIEELLSDTFEELPGQKADAVRAARRLAAWCMSATSGDWELFSQRLRRDGYEFSKILPRLASVRRNPRTPDPSWVADARWIYSALTSTLSQEATAPPGTQAEPFIELLTPLIDAAEAHLCSIVAEAARRNLDATAVSCLRRLLVRRLSLLCAPAFYDIFLRSAAYDTASESRISESSSDDHRWRYERFLVYMRSSGLRTLFEQRPVLLRLIATITRQWIATNAEFMTRLHSDLSSIREHLFRDAQRLPVASVESGLSDLHNAGRSVSVVTFLDGGRVLYKPKDLTTDQLWYELIESLNQSAPIQLRTPRVLARTGYGWSEFVEHTSVPEHQDLALFFRRTGAWLALFHIFVASDMHAENMIAAGSHPVPVDLEMLLQSVDEGTAVITPATQASALAGRKIFQSVMMTGLLPTYGTPRRPSDDRELEHPHVDSENTHLYWENVNTDTMHPVRKRTVHAKIVNMPRCNSHEAHQRDFVEEVVLGFEQYARFLLSLRKTADGQALLEPFRSVTIRRLLKHTRYYSLLIGRLTDFRNMADGAEWSTHLDFGARLLDWDNSNDPMWPILKAERNALVQLDVPHFVSRADTDIIEDAAGPLTQTGALSGFERAKRRLETIDEDDIAWQTDVIRLTTKSVEERLAVGGEIETTGVLDDEEAHSSRFTTAAAAVCDEITRLAIQSGTGTAWLGFDWQGDSRGRRPSALGVDLYNGAPGLCLFLAAYANVTGRREVADLACSGLSTTRYYLRSATKARFVRGIGIGAAMGLGSVVYSLASIGQLLGREELVQEAHAAAALLTEDLVAADQALDVMDGSAGAIVALLKLYRISANQNVLRSAIRCGDHLLRAKRFESPGGRTWRGNGAGERPLNGMSHGAAGFAYALAALSDVTDREDYRVAASECIAFENHAFNASLSNWPDFRQGASPSRWANQWCHGAGGIGLARIGIWRHGRSTGNVVGDICRSVQAVQRHWPSAVHTLCCGSLGNIELLNEAADVLDAPELRSEARRRLTALVEADERGNAKGGELERRFSLGLFRGRAGLGYTLLRQIKRELPNVLIWS